MKKYLDKFFEWGTDLLPSWMRDDSKFASWIVNLLWVDCAYCLGMRFAFVGTLLGGTLGFILGCLL